MGRKTLNKIFVIGFNKSGTKTLHTFFKENGLRSIHWHEGRIATKMVQNAMSGRKLLRGYDRKYKVFSDMIWLTERICIEGNSFYRVLDRDYPGSAFIYNTRDEDAWIESRLNHASGRFLEDYQQLLNATSVEQVTTHWKDTRRRFEKELFSYFAGRNDLLVFDIGHDMPDRINSFLSLDLELSKYGWENKTKSK